MNFKITQDTEDSGQKGHSVVQCNGWLNYTSNVQFLFKFIYRTGGYYHHVSENNATAPPNLINTSDTQNLSLETCDIMILKRWYDQHCTLTVASGHILK